MLTDLELENAELTESNEKLDRELKCLKRQESRRSASNETGDDCVDDGYGHWSHDEEDFPFDSPARTTELKMKLDTCSGCQAHAIDKAELFEQIEELHQQLEIVQKVNKLLQEDVTQKAAQVLVAMSFF